MNFLQESQPLPKVSMLIMTDSTSAKAIATRMGVSKLTRHIQLRFLYMQDLVANNITKIKKVGTKFNIYRECVEYCLDDCECLDQCWQKWREACERERTWQALPRGRIARQCSGQ